MGVKRKVNARDDFPRPVKELLARRVGYRCSNPSCRTLTVGPQSVVSKTANVGEAAHITAASPRGPRYNPQMSAEERRGYNNGIWLCRNHAKLVDDDQNKFGVNELLDWKEKAEKDAAKELEGTAKESKARRPPFASREQGEFEYFHAELDVLIRVSASTEMDHHYWRVYVSALELLLLCYRKSQDYFAPSEITEYKFVSISESSEEINFSLSRWYQGSAWEYIRCDLLKFGLISKGRGSSYYPEYTKRMRRFIYWIEYNRIIPSKSACEDARIA